MNGLNTRDEARCAEELVMEEFKRYEVPTGRCEIDHEEGQRMPQVEILLLVLNGLIKHLHHLKALREAGKPMEGLVLLIDII